MGAESTRDGLECVRVSECVSKVGRPMTENCQWFDKHRHIGTVENGPMTS